MILKSRPACRIARGLLIGSALAGFAASAAQAQSAAVNLCTGVSLPRSAVTDLLSPVINGVVAPVENRVNAILDVVRIIPIVGQAIAPLDTNVSGLLSSAASGAPISLQILDTNGNVVDAADGCNLQADSLSLATPAGLAIGGNRISGLGANGAAAFAGDIDAVAFGNGARTEVAATEAVAIGHDARVTAANSVAIGAGSSATRGPQLAYAALALDGSQFSAGEFAVGASGAERQITHVAPGSAPTDAVNVAQLQGIATRVASVDARVTTNTTVIANHETRITALEASGNGSGGTAAPGPVRYADAGAPTLPNGGTPSDDATLVGASGGPVGLHNVRAGQLAANSTDAVNGGQLHATNQQVAQNTTNIQNNTTRITILEGALSGSTVGPVQYSSASAPNVPNGGTISNDVTLVGAGGAPVAVHNVANGRVSADSTDAVNGRQLHAVSVQAANSVQYDAGGQSVTFGPGNAPVRLGNVAAGVGPSDAVNVGQLNAGLQSAVAEAQTYVDARFDLLGRDMDGLRRDANGGTAGALAAAALPQASDPGRGMVAFGTGVFQGQAAFAMGLSTRLDNGQAVVRAGATVDTRGRAGANAGVGIQF